MRPAAIIGTRAIAKRVIWRDAHGCRLPFAAEYSMAKPMLEITAISSTSPHWIARTLSARVSSRRLMSGAKLAMRYRSRHRDGGRCALGHRVGRRYPPRRIASLRLDKDVSADRRRYCRTAAAGLA